MPLQFRPTTSNITPKVGGMVNPLVGTHLSSHKLSLGSLIPTVSPKTARIQDTNLRIIVSNILHPTTLRAFQRENQEMREAQKRTESQLNHLTEMLQKFTNQQVQPQPPAPSPLPSQPLPNQKGSINVVLDKGINEDEDEDEDVEWLYELLAKLADSDDEEDEQSEEESDEEDEDKSIEEEGEEESDKEEDESELAEEEDIDDRDKGKTFFINTLFKEKKSEEEIPIKCEDPGPCLVTCKIRGVSIPYCLCDPGLARFNRQSSERKWLKKARGMRRSQTKPRRPFLDPVHTHPKASVYAPIALGGTPRVDRS
ncbi:hypothetical protein PIB30_083893 [Stylosanthes scabra]|uniref:Uncharacterized protein n=1 Tax=Stylosanthes scabra TaxID=79078 RepID=A0ABU6RSK6_9FABA|nr:hypothetical protein [Stylosanthes scabra]